MREDFAGGGGGGDSGSLGWVLFGWGFYVSIETWYIFSFRWWE